MLGKLNIVDLAGSERISTSGVRCETCMHKAIELRADKLPRFILTQLLRTYCSHSYEMYAFHLCVVVMR